MKEEKDFEFIIDDDIQFTKEELIKMKAAKAENIKWKLKNIFRKKETFNIEDEEIVI